MKTSNPPVIVDAQGVAWHEALTVDLINAVNDRFGFEPGRSLEVAEVPGLLRPEMCIYGPEPEKKLLGKLINLGDKEPPHGV